MAGYLTAEQKRFYQDNGYIVLRGVFPLDEMRACRKDLHDLAARLEQQRGDINATWPSVRDRSHRIQHCHDVQFQCASMTRLICDPRLVGPLTEMIGPNIQLHHTKMFIKPPEKGAPFPLHQDWPYFPHERDTMTAAVIHFDDSSIQKGCVRVVPGSYKRGPLPPADDAHDHSLPQDAFPIDSATPCEARAGDVLFFNYLTIHGSGMNLSDEPRTTLLVQVRDPEDLPKVRAHESNGQGMMLAGYDPRGGVKPSWDRPAEVAAT